MQGSTTMHSPTSSMRVAAVLVSCGTGSAVTTAACTDGVSGRICTGSPSEATTKGRGSAGAAAVSVAGLVSVTGLISMTSFDTSSRADATSGVSGATKPNAAIACGALACGLAVASML